jgi:hypothetical protein
MYKTLTQVHTSKKWIESYVEFDIVLFTMGKDLIVALTIIKAKDWGYNMVLPTPPF